MPKFEWQEKYVLVPARFIEKYMPKANASFVKVYLMALNAATNNELIEYSAIARELNLLESDVIQAVNYWQEEGLVRVYDDVVSFDVDKKPQKDIEDKQDIKVVPQKQKRPEYSQDKVAMAIAENNTLSEMVLVAQEILGKTLNPSDVETLYWIYDGLKFLPEVILMLLEYCVSKEKRRMSYVEKVAISWHERGVTSIDAVNEYLKKESERSGFIYQIRKTLGILDRGLSQTEEQFITRWKDMYNMDEEMISHAYEQCIIQTAKLSFPYMEKILERWYKQGIHTVEMAKEDSKIFKGEQQFNSKKGGYEVYSESYDHNSLAELTRMDDNEE